jgi:hypothetical protein
MELGKRGKVIKEDYLVTKEMNYRAMYQNENVLLKPNTQPRRPELRPLPSPASRKNVQHPAKYGMMIFKVVLIIATIAFFYVREQASVTDLRNEKGKLESAYEELKVSNDLYYEDIMSKVDIKEIERIAVEDLGMKMAGQGQIYTYSNDVDDYVKQYAEIPN